MKKLKCCFWEKLFLSFLILKALVIITKSTFSSLWQNVWTVPWEFSQLILFHDRSNKKTFLTTQLRGVSTKKAQNTFLRKALELFTTAPQIINLSVHSTNICRQIYQYFQTRAWQSFHVLDLFNKTHILYRISTVTCFFLASLLIEFSYELFGKWKIH